MDCLAFFPQAVEFVGLDVVDVVDSVDEEREREGERRRLDQGGGFQGASDDDERGDVEVQGEEVELRATCLDVEVEGLEAVT